MSPKSITRVRRALTLALALVCAFVCSAERGEPEMSAAEGESRVTFCCAGDFVIHSAVFASALKAGGGREYDFSPMLECVAPYMRGADFTLTNVDGVLGDAEFVRKHGISGYPAFSTPASLLEDLKQCGVDMLPLANNHALDFWYDGLKTTVSTVESAGLLHVGGYRSRAERETPLIVEIGGIRVGFLNYTDGLNKMDEQKGLDKAALDYGVAFTKYADIPGDVARLRAAGAEAVVCMMHWGAEYKSVPGQGQKNLARTLADAGVDVIVGSHPHMIQKAEYLTAKDGKQVLCLYSLGNFLSDQRDRGTDCGMLFEFTLHRDEDGRITVEDPVYRTTWVWRRMQSGEQLYTVLFSDDVSSRPEEMSEKDYARMRQSAEDTREIMDTGCARPAIESGETVAAPQR